MLVVTIVVIRAILDLLDLVALHRRREYRLVHVLGAGAGRRSLSCRRHHRVVVEPVCRAVLDLQLVFESLFEALGVINQNFRIIFFCDSSLSYRINMN